MVKNKEDGAKILFNCFAMPVISAVTKVEKRLNEVRDYFIKTGRLDCSLVREYDSLDFLRNLDKKGVAIELVYMSNEEFLKNREGIELIGTLAYLLNKCMESNMIEKMCKEMEHIYFTEYEKMRYLSL